MAGGCDARNIEEAYREAMTPSPGCASDPLVVEPAPASDANVGRVFSAKVCSCGAIENFTEFGFCFACGADVATDAVRYEACLLRRAER